MGLWYEEPVIFAGAALRVICNGYISVKNKKKAGLYLTLHSMKYIICIVVYYFIAEKFGWNLSWSYETEKFR